VSLRGDLDDARHRVAALTDERDTLRRAATATVFDLAPTAQGPASASGTLYLTATGSGVLEVVNLPASGQGTVYQLWFVPPDDGPLLPGATFTVDADGTGFALVAADTGAFKGVSISAEPEGGSETPTGPLLLSGATSGARG
jgi:anti-sigma-K factor RskA